MYVITIRPMRLFAMHKTSFTRNSTYSTKCVLAIVVMSVRQSGCLSVCHVAV